MGFTYRQGKETRLSIEEMDNNFLYAEEQISSLTASVVSLEQSIDDINTVIAGITASEALQDATVIAGLTASVITLTNNLASATASIATLNTNLASATASIATLSADVAGLTASVYKYKVYTALLTQTATASPVATILENTIGNIVFTRNDVGYYTGTLVSAFTAGKTIPYSFSSAESWNNYRISCEREDSDSVTIYLESGTSGTPLEISASGYEIFIQIKVYN